MNEEKSVVCLRGQYEIEVKSKTKVNRETPYGKIEPVPEKVLDKFYANLTRFCVDHLFTRSKKHCQ